MPNAANMPMLLERPQSNGVELTWRTQSSNSSGPILYLVSSRSNVGRHFSDVDMTSWQAVTKVSDSACQWHLGLVLATAVPTYFVSWFLPHLLMVSGL